MTEFPKTPKELLADPTNAAVIAEFEQHDAVVEAEAAALREAAEKLFDPADLFKQTKLIHSGVHPLLGTVRYGDLTLEDSFTTAKCRNPADQTSMAIYLMLKKAYPNMPNYTPDNISEWRKTLPMAEGAALLIFFKNTPAFLRTQSLSGSNTTSKQKTSP